MKKKDYPASWLRYILLMSELVGFIFVFIVLLFDPYFEATVDGQLIGFYKTQEEFEDCYDIVKKQDYEDGIYVNKYLDSKPKFKLVLAKDKYVKNYNNCALIEEQIKKQYTIYCINVNEKDEIYVKTNEEAEKLVKEIKKEVKSSTKITIKEIKTEDKSLIKDNKSITKTKEQVIKNNYKISSRGGGIRVNTANSKYLWPTISRTITSGFGARWNSTHRGIDIAVPLNSKVYAVDNGKVILAGWNGSYGYQVKIQHSNGIVTTYGHCNKILVKAGQQVKQGDVIARSGSTGNSTGPHLHFEYIINGVFKNPLNYI